MRVPLSRREPSGPFPLQTPVDKVVAGGDGTTRVEHVYDFNSPYCRMRRQNTDWEEFTESDIEKVGLSPVTEVSSAVLTAVI